MSMAFGDTPDKDETPPGILEFWGPSPRVDPPPHRVDPMTPRVDMPTEKVDTFFPSDVYYPH